MSRPVGLIVPELCKTHLDQVQLEETRRGTKIVVYTKISVALFQRAAARLAAEGGFSPENPLSPEQLQILVDGVAPLCCWLGQEVFEDLLVRAYNMTADELNNPPDGIKPPGKVQ